MTKTRDLADLGGGFIQAGTGAVQRTVESKLQDVVSVKDFGAKGDGVTNDTAAIQAAINYVQSFHIPETYASASPGPGVTELIFPFGVYKITAALTVTRSISFRGEGHSEFSVGARIIQYTAATDHFRVNPIAQGCSVSWDDLTMTASGNGGTAGYCININKTTAVCNSVRIRNCTFGTPQSGAIRLQSSDDVIISGNLFDVSAFHSIILGTSSATDVVSNCRIEGNAFYGIAGFVFLLYNVSNLVITSNVIYKAVSNTATVLDGYNTLPYQIKNVVFTNNTIDGADCVAQITSAQGFVCSGNIGTNLGAGVGATKSLIQLDSTLKRVTISNNQLSGNVGAKHFYDTSGGTLTEGASVCGNIFIASGGTGNALFVGPHIGVIGENLASGFSTDCLGSKVVTSGNAISVGVVNSLASAVYTRTVSGALPGDTVIINPTSTTWFAPPGIVVSAFVSAGNTVSIQYTNVTGSPIGVPAHDLRFIVVRY